jgi:hypothetical protein
VPEHDPPPYLVSPRSAGDGFTLTGPTLPHALWYLVSAQAVEYARWHCRVEGGLVIVLDAAGRELSREIVGQLQIGDPRPPHFQEK